MTEVIKKNGKKEEFQPDKLKRSVEQAAREVKLSEEKMKQIVVKSTKPVIEYIYQKPEVKTQEIKEKVVEAVEKEHKEVAKAMKEFEKKKNHNHDQ